MDISEIKGVGPKIKKALNSLGIYTVKDAIYYFPRDYENRNNFKNINEIIDGENVCILANVALIDRVKRSTSGKTISRIIFKNETGFVVGVWFNKPYITKTFKIGENIFLYGKVSKKLGEIQIVDPQYEKGIENISEHIIPIYPVNKSISQKVLRNIIYKSMDYMEQEIEEIYPRKFLDRNELIDIATAIKDIHFPKDKHLLKKAKYRLIFDEFLIFQSGIFLAKESIGSDNSAYSIKVTDSMMELKNSLPYELTKAQSRTVREILQDMKKEKPMNRLVQGDVGSGKTIVAAIAIFNCVMNGYQAAMMAPTEILAKQHYISIADLMAKWGLNVALLTGSTSKKEKRKILDSIKNGDIDIIIGTHALIQEDVNYKNLALVVTDEQHRFGVRQRAKLINKGHNPHVIIMTATPIPRTLALFMYADMDISIIDELPPGRQKIETYFVTRSMEQRIYDFIKKQIKDGRQTYIVCPLIEESEKLNINSAMQIWEDLNKYYLADFKVGLLHGKMNSKEKESIMSEFVDGKIDVLVSTTVIEVGVDVPNANVMIIENAERFGLAQLHQLRGRVGRGKHKSYCILFSDSKTDECRKRMKIMVDTNDGFIIAEKDMEMRGMGEFLGTKQHGYQEFKIANISRDITILKKTKEIMKKIMEEEDIESITIKNTINKILEKAICEIALN